MGARRTAVLNNRGGVGKSDLAVRLAGALAKRGKRVGILDFDPQGNASRRCGWRYDEENPQITVSEAVMANRVGTMAKVWTPVKWDIEYASRMTLAPAWLELENRMAEAGVVGNHLRLAKALQGADDHLDEVLIDCPPSLFHITQMALAAAHQALIVTEPEIDSILGAKRVRDFVGEKRGQLHNDELVLAGVVVNNLDPAGKPLEREQLRSIRRIFGDLVWDPVVHRRAALATADNQAIPLELTKASGAAPARATFELLAETYEKRSVSAA
jgi:cellulose biosynthesis protein BcsQ